jgi:hypothetical protein
MDEFILVHSGCVGYVIRVWYVARAHFIRGWKGESITHCVPRQCGDPLSLSHTTSEDEVLKQKLYICILFYFTSLFFIESFNIHNI